MDFGCLDLGCLDKYSDEAIRDSRDSESSEKSTSASKLGKSRSPKGTGQLSLNALNKFTSQIKKPSYRKSSPLNWFPRKKADYLKKKIKMLQEVDGMNLTLDETLGDSNPHYSRVLREKMAAREAAHKAMEARKAALVEASWCRILKAARIHSKEADSLLLMAEKNAVEAFEAAAGMGVIMYDIPNCPKKACDIETSIQDGGRSTTHTVTASFETAFEVDRQVAAAVKTAFTRLANCPSFTKEEVKELLRKISQNPDAGDDNQESFEFSSECEAESGSELETVSQSDGFVSDVEDHKLPILETRPRKCKRRQSLERFNPMKLVDMMLERLRCLNEDELSSLATIVATCGLNAALEEVGSAADCNSKQAINLPRRTSSVGAFMGGGGGHMKKNQIQPGLPSLDKFLVKHTSKLEREVQEAKNRRNQSKEGIADKAEKETDGLGNRMTSSETIPDLGSIFVKRSSKLEKEIEEAKKTASWKDVEIGPPKKPVSNMNSSEAIPDLGSILIKHSSKLEKEVQESRRNFGRASEMNRVTNKRKEDTPEAPSLDKVLVKRMSRLEQEIQDAKDRRKNEKIEEGRVAGKQKKNTSSHGEVEGKENINLLNKEADGKSEANEGECRPEECTGESMNKADNESEDSLDKILVKPVHRLEKEKLQASSTGGNYGYRRHQNNHGGNAAVNDGEGLDKVLVKHVSRLEKEKMAFRLLDDEKVKVKRSGGNVQSHLNNEGSLDQILVKSTSRLEKEKMAFRLLLDDEQVKVKRSGRNMHSHLNNEGSLDQILVKSTSRLEKEKIASAAQEPGDQVMHSVSRRAARERELQEAWGGLSLGNSIQPHLSRLEREKAVWIKAEEEERAQAVME